MTSKSNISTTKDKRFGTLVTLSNTTVTGAHMKVTVAPERGSNICHFSYGSCDIFYCDEAMLQSSGFTGNFALWPIPNRLENHEYTFERTRYAIQGLDRKVDRNLVHGFVFDQSWQFVEPVVNEDTPILNTFFDFDPTHPYFNGYPFPSRLSLAIKLEPDGLRVTYTVQNKGSQRMPFGFGLHPCFKLLPDTRVQIPAKYVMEANQELLPTGKLTDVANDHDRDLRKPRKVASLRLDDVYTGITSGKWAVIDHPAERFRIHLETSDDFTHIVMYASSGPFFCLENQTCPTNALNLLAKGLGQEAHVIELDPGQEHTGYIKYKIEPY